MRSCRRSPRAPDFRSFEPPRWPTSRFAVCFRRELGLLRALLRNLRPSGSVDDKHERARTRWGRRSADVCRLNFLSCERVFRLPTFLPPSLIEFIFFFVFCCEVKCGSSRACGRAASTLQCARGRVCCKFDSFHFFSRPHCRLGRTGENERKTMRAGRISSRALLLLSLGSSGQKATGRASGISALRPLPKVAMGQFE